MRTRAQNRRSRDAERREGRAIRQNAPIGSGPITLGRFFEVRGRLSKNDMSSQMINGCQNMWERIRAQ
jgi:hypothetical protein